VGEGCSALQVALTTMPPSARGNWRALSMTKVGWPPSALCQAMFCMSMSPRMGALVEPPEGLESVTSGPPPQPARIVTAKKTTGVRRVPVVIVGIVLEPGR
jgi:hypothetical protein